MLVKIPAGVNIIRTDTGYMYRTKIAIVVILNPTSDPGIALFRYHDIEYSVFVSFVEKYRPCATL
jgi:hypothetical protein